MRLRFRTLQHPPAPKCFPPLWLQSRDVNFIAWKCLPCHFGVQKVWQLLMSSLLKFGAPIRCFVQVIVHFLSLEFQIQCTINAYTTYTKY